MPDFMVGSVESLYEEWPGCDGGRPTPVLQCCWLVSLAELPNENDLANGFGALGEEASVSNDWDLLVLVPK
jgi:hypothetical protein